MTSKKTPAVDRGAATMWAAIWLVLTGVMLIGVVEVGRAAHDAARAQSAADAAALAGAIDGHDGAVDAAARNGAGLVSQRAFGQRITVVVRVGRAERAATAEWVLIPRQAASAGPRDRIHSTP